MMEKVCACGCGQSFLPAKRGAGGRATIYMQNHHLRVKHPRLGVRFSSRHRIAPGGQACSCGCGAWLAETFPSGNPRYSKTGLFYATRTCSPNSNKHKVFSHAARIMHGNYWYVYQPDHPDASKANSRTGYILEHRVVWERANGRRLQGTEHVHHINGNPVDNRPDNLIALTRAEHAKIHSKGRSTAHLSEAGRKGAQKRWRQH